MENRVHRVKDKTVIRRFKIFPYDELVKILKKDDAAFFEDSPEQPLKPGTVWKAARKLSQMVGKKVVAKSVVYQVNENISLEGYLFSVQAPGSASPKDTS